MPRTPAPAKQVFSLFRLEAEAFLSKVNPNSSVIIDLFHGFDLIKLLFNIFSMPDTLQDAGD